MDSRIKIEPKSGAENEYCIYEPARKCFESEFDAKKALDEIDRKEKNKDEKVNIYRELR